MARRVNKGNGSKTINRDKINIHELSNISKTLEAEQNISQSLVTDRRDIGHGLVNLSGVLTPITYFNQIPDATNGDMININGVNNIAHNSTVYNQIDGLEVKFDSSIELEQENNVSDILQSYTQSGTIQFIQKTIIPYINDYFMLKVENIYRLYKITEVTIDTVSFNPSHKASFVLDNKGDNFILEEWTNYDNIKTIYEYNRAFLGTNFKVLFTKDEKILFESCQRVYETLSEIYISKFFDRDADTFFLRDSYFDFDTNEFTERENTMVGSSQIFDINPVFYDNHLVNFITRNSIFTRDNYDGVISVSKLFEDEDSEYNLTLFRAIEDQDIERYKLTALNKYFVQHSSSVHPISLYQRYIITHSDRKLIDSGVDFIHPVIMKTINFYDSTVGLENRTYESIFDIVAETIALYILKKDEKGMVERIIYISKHLNEFYPYKNIFPYDIYYLYPIMCYIINKYTEYNFSNSNNDIYNII